MSSSNHTADGRYFKPSLTYRNDHLNGFVKQISLSEPFIHTARYILVAKNVRINPLKTKRRLLYLKTQFVPRSKHFSSRL